jgi:hypothetical protein
MQAANRHADRKFAGPEEKQSGAIFVSLRLATLVIAAALGALSAPAHATGACIRVIVPDGYDAIGDTLRGRFKSWRTLSKTTMKHVNVAVDGKDFPELKVKCEYEIAEVILNKPIDLKEDGTIGSWYSYSDKLWDEQRVIKREDDKTYPLAISLALSHTDCGMPAEEIAFTNAAILYLITELEDDVRKGLGKALLTNLGNSKLQCKGPKVSEFHMRRLRYILGRLSSGG